MLEAGGGYLGSTLGAFAYDLLGFQWATVVESGVRFILTNLSFFSQSLSLMPCPPPSHPYHQGDGWHSVGPGGLHAPGKTAMSIKRNIYFRAQIYLIFVKYQVCSHHFTTKTD